MKNHKQMSIRNLFLECTCLIFTYLLDGFAKFINSTYVEQINGSTTTFEFKEMFIIVLEIFKTILHFLVNNTVH